MEAIESVGKNQSVEELLKVKICGECINNLTEVLFLVLVINLHSYRFGHQTTGGFKSPVQLNCEGLLCCH